MFNFDNEWYKELIITIADILVCDEYDQVSDIIRPVFDFNGDIINEL